MKTSTDRILATHVGSLPRPAGILEVLQAQERGDAVDREAFEPALRAAVSDLVGEQRERGIDVVADGEMGKPSFLTYVNERLAGFEPVESSGDSPWAGSKEMAEFAEFYEDEAKRSPSPAATARHMVCTGPISYVGTEQVQRDIANLKAAAESHDAPEAFMTAISPTNVAGWQRNEHYATDEEFLFAVADAMHEEYKAIVDSGLILQVDDPGLVTQYAVSDWSVDQVREWAAVRVEAINHALRGIPRDRVRFHTCYSINIGPRVHDMELKDVIDLLLKIEAGGYSFEAANPRHEHEWRLWGDIDLPDGVVLIPGVVTNSSVLVEHPDVVAQRILQFAQVVGRERVIAGADCGFATFAGATDIHPTIAWAKLASLGEGARRASEQLWGPNGHAS